MSPTRNRAESNSALATPDEVDLTNGTATTARPSPTGGVDIDQMPGVVRLSVNLAPDVAKLLRARASGKGISITEAIRRAIAVWDFLESERESGHRLAIIERDGAVERVREIVLVS